MNVNQDPSGDETSVDICTIAIDRAISANFSEEYLYEVLAAAPSKKAQVSSLRLNASAKHLFANARFTAVTARIADVLPKAVANRNPLLKSIREDYERAHTMLKNSLFKEAIDWAQYAMEAQPDLVVSLCMSEIGHAIMAQGVDRILNPDGDGHRKRSEKNREKFFARAASLEARLEADPTLDEEKAVAMAAEELYGGARPLMAYSLALQYGHLITFLVIATIGSPPELLELMGTMTGIENDEFRLDVVEFSEIIDYLGPGAVACAVGGDEISYLVSDAAGGKLQTIEALCGEIESLVEAQAVEKQQARKVEEQLRDEIRRQSLSIAAMQGAQATDTTRALQAELAALQKEVQRLRDELGRRDESLARRQATAKHDSPAKDRAAPVAPAAPSVKELNYEESLAQLQGMKAVVVGGHSIFHAKLHDLLPGWACYTADEVGVEAGVVRNADLVVFHTNYCSHKLSEGVLRTARTHGTPVVYAYKVNPRAFVLEVVKAIKAKRESQTGADLC